MLAGRSSAQLEHYGSISADAALLRAGDTTREARVAQHPSVTRVSGRWLIARMVTQFADATRGSLGTSGLDIGLVDMTPRVYATLEDFVGPICIMCLHLHIPRFSYWQ